MARRAASLPSYRKCRVHGNVRAAVTLSDAVTRQRRTFYLGEYGTPDSREKYLRLVAEWETLGRRLPCTDDRPMTLTSGPTVTQLCLAFWTAIDGRYSHQQLGHFKASIRILREYYGETSASDFGPKAMRLLRDEMVRGGETRRRWTRTYTNRQVGLIRQIFRWGVSHELVSTNVLQALKAIEPLKRGRTDALEADPVGPVPQHIIDATLPYLNRQVRAVVELQILTGARPTELLGLRPCDISTSEYPGVWSVHFAEHKTAHHGCDRTIYFGPQAQRVLQPFIAHRAESAYLFSPKEAEMERRYALHAARKTPLSCGNRPGSNRKSSPRRRPHDRYTTASYRRAIDTACKKAFPMPEHLRRRKGEKQAELDNRLLSDEKRELKEWRKAHHWHPYQLRHNAATSLRKAFGLEAAQLILGHSSACITDAVYADRDQEKIVNIVQEIG